jgi:amidase
MKPTTGRLPVNGWSATMGGAEQIVPTIGPLSTSLEGCKLFIKTIIDAKPWYKEPSLLPFPWKEDDPFNGKKLKVAVLWDDGVVKPHPPVTRALKQVVDKLKSKGNVEVVEWKPYKHDLAWEIIVSFFLCFQPSAHYCEKANLYFSDGGAEEIAAIEASGEPLRPLTTHILKDNPHVQSHTITSMWRSIQRRDAYRTEYANLWNSTATVTGANDVLKDMIDVILCPVGPSAAPKIDTAKWWGYTSQWNLLDYPAVVFPVDQVDTVIDAAKEDYTPKNEKDKYNWDLWEKYGAEGYKDAPVSLQLVGRRYVLSWV